MDHEEIPAEVRRWIEDLYHFLFADELEGGNDDDVTLPDGDAQETQY